MNITFSNNQITKINQMDFLNKSIFSCEKEDANDIVKLVDKLLDRIKNHCATIQGLVLVTEGQYNDHVSLYCWCTSTHGFLVSKSSNNAYNTFILDATEYENYNFVSKSQLDSKSLDYIFPIEKRTGDWKHTKQSSQ